MMMMGKSIYILLLYSHLHHCLNMLPWGQLFSSSQTTYSLVSDATTIGCGPSCGIYFERGSRIQCVVMRKKEYVWIVNQSTDTLLNEVLLEMDEERSLQNEDVISFQEIKLTLRIAQETKEVAMNGFFELADVGLERRLRRSLFCKICFEVMALPVELRPCLHHFCAGCLSILIKRGETKCAVCSQEIKSAQPDKLYLNICTNFLRRYPFLKRNLRQASELDRSNIFKEGTINLNSNTLQKKGNSPAFISDNEQDEQAVSYRVKPVVRNKSQQQCDQCISQRNGFQCQLNQKHIRCKNCGRLFALRREFNNQSCAVCGVFLCNLYLGKCQIFLPRLMELSKRESQIKIEKGSFRNNVVEMEVFNSLLFSQHKTIKQVLAEILGKADDSLFQFISEPKMQSSSSGMRVPLNRRSVTCDRCWRQVWLQMIFHYQQANRDKIPLAITSRPECYWGVNCRSMGHNIEHAKKYNHMVEQTKFQSHNNIKTVGFGRLPSA